MQYINKNRGGVAANLNYQCHGCWEVHPVSGNRYRLLFDSDTEAIKAIDLEGGPMIQVGSELPGYNRVVSEINHIVGDNNQSIESSFEVFCDDEFTID